jgi:hypothetical protein
LKRILSMVILCLLVLIPVVRTQAATATVSVTLPATLRPGMTFTATVSMNGTGLEGIRGDIVYNANLLTLNSYRSALSSWDITLTKGGSGANSTLSILGVINGLTADINKNTVIVTMNFTVKTNIVGTRILISPSSSLKVSDITHEFTPSLVAGSRTVSAPLSGNADLKSLVIGSASLDPAFSPATIEYAVTVPFDVAKLSVTAAPSDASSRVAVDDVELTPGGATDVRIVVTAANGATKTYVLHATRAQDPNYKPSNDATLRDLTVDGFYLSPAYSADSESTTYLVLLPYEIDEIRVRGLPTYGKASAASTGNTGIIAGIDRVVKVVCTAEDGITTKEYTIIARRALPFDPKASPALSPTPTPAPTALQPTLEEPTATPVPQTGFDGNDSDFPVVGTVVVILVTFGLGIFLMNVVMRKVSLKGHPHDP